MAYEKSLLKLEMRDIVYVKPSKSTPSSILSLSTIDNKDGKNAICQIVRVYRSTSSSIHDPAHLIKHALSNALFYYFPLAGRLVKHPDDGKLRINCNPNAQDYGVPFLEAIANCTLSSIHYLDGEENEITKHLVLDFPSPQDKTYPLVFMVTKFLCGGFTIGIGLSHAVCDGFGASQIFKSIVELSKGRTEPSVKPVWERHTLVGTITTQPFQCLIDKDSVAFSPFLKPKSDIKLYRFKVESEAIKRLKISLMKEIGNGNNVTSFESLAAYVWKSKAKALKLSSNGKTMLTMEVGMRGKNLKDYNLPKGYYGNTIVDANVVLKVNELNEKSLFEIVKVIKETKNVAFTNDYVRKSMDTLETIKEEEMEENMKDGVMLVTEWKHLGLMESVEFEGYEAMNLVPAACTLLNSIDTCIFMPFDKVDDPLMIGGGVKIFISLPVFAMPMFREEIEALMFL